MARLVYAAITSLDGYVADDSGSFDWAEPDEEVHTFVNDLDRPVGLQLYGRRMYEVMVALHRGICEDLAGRRQDRLLNHAEHCLLRQDTDRTTIRARDCPPP